MQRLILLRFTEMTAAMIFQYSFQEPSCFCVYDDTCVMDCLSLTLYVHAAKCYFLTI